MKKLFKKAEFVIWESDDGYVVQNMSVEGFCHTHLEHYNTAVKIVDLSIQKKMPYNLPRYLLISLRRINTEPTYCRKLDELLKKHRKDSYFNANKGVRKK